MTENDRRLRGSETRLLRGYAPVVCALVAFFMMATLAPSISPEQLAVTETRDPTSPRPSAGGPTPADPDGGTSDSGPAAQSDATAAQAAEAPATAGAIVCEGVQVSGDPYSPPCRQWAGDDNGGATARGVSATEIHLSLRDVGFYDVGAIFQQLTGRNLGTAAVSQDQWLATYRTLAEYFNQRFELYGRKFVIDSFKANGSVTDEILGGGQAGANADAIQVSDDIGAFADVSIDTLPFATALTDRQVITSNVLYAPRQWMEDRAPYAWSFWPDCTKIAENAADYLLRAVVGRPAELAGGDLKDRPRKLGIVYPETPAYKDCGDIITNTLRSEGHGPADVRVYALSLDTIPSSSQSIASAFASQEITTVVLFTEPLTPLFMTSTAEQNNWQPEWFQGGTAFLDFDFAGQLYEPEQWKRAFGISMRGPEVPATASLPYAAYRSVDPNSSPDPFIAYTAFYQLYVIAVGVHMAGPNLTPDTFAAGMHSYSSPATGPEGRWAFPDGDQSAPQEVRILAWDPNAISPYNNQSGHYLDTGTSYPTGEVPDVGPPFP